MNKKALYESIMRRVAKNVERTLNEGEMFDEEEPITAEMLWDKLIENDIATEDELQLVTDVAGYSVNTLNAVLYSRTGYNDWYQYAEEL